MSACLLGLALPVAAGELRVGLGTAPLPAPLGGVLAGYAAPWDRRAEGVWDAPEARAIVLDTATSRVGLVVLDVLIPRPVLREPLRERAARLELDLLILVATHTHSGPGGYLPGFIAERLSMGSYRAAAPEELREAALQALVRAVADLSPARVAADSARAELAVNRNRPGGARETALPLLRFDFDDGRAPAVLFAYGAHPIVLSPASHGYSADYPGRARTWLEERGWRPVFLPGPLGDQAPVSSLGALWPDEVSDQRAQVREIGESLGRAVLAGLRQLVPGGEAELRAVEHWVEAPHQRARRFCPLWWLGPLTARALDAQLSRRVPIAAVRIGRADLLALPAEPTSAIGAALRDAIGPERVAFVVAHANDWIGYAVSEADYAAGGYEACMSFHGPEFGPWLVTNARRALRLLDSPR
ncbi:MAG: neutral/alkaline non-lysosomal ceramidase N-terminal domain-containing protein [Myxococcota bacterium]